MSAPVRIFVLGLQRSGTTWLANMLEGVPQLVGVTDAAHHGIHESVYFSHFVPAFSEWRDPDVRARFLRAFGASDYFRLTGLSLSWLEQIVAQASGPEAVFVAVMDTYAEGQGARGWLEKSPHHSFCAEAIAAAVPDARFVIVERDVMALVTSRMYGFGRNLRPAPGRWGDAARGALAARHASRVLRVFAKRNPQALLVHYEDLIGPDGAGVRARLLRFVGLDGDAHAMQSRFGANSSFGATRKRLDPVTRAIVRLVSCFAIFVPLRWLQARHQARAVQRGHQWPDWVWTQTGYDPEEDAVAVCEASIAHNPRK